MHKEIFLQKFWHDLHEMNSMIIVDSPVECWICISRKRQLWSKVYLFYPHPLFENLIPARSLFGLRRRPIRTRWPCPGGWPGERGACVVMYDTKRQRAITQPRTYTTHYSLTHSPTSHPNTRIRGLTPSSTLRVRFDRSHSDAVYNVSPDFTSTVPDTNLCQAESGRGPRMARRSHAPIHATRNKPKNAKNCAISRVNQSQALTILAKSNASVWWHWPPSGKSPHWSMASLRASVAFVEFFALNGGWETSQSLPDNWVRVLV